MGFDAELKRRAAGAGSPLALARAKVAAADAALDVAAFALRAAMRAHPEASGGLGVLAAAVDRALAALRSDVAGQADRATLGAVLGATEAAPAETARPMPERAAAPVGAASDAPDAAELFGWGPGGPAA